MPILAARVICLTALCGPAAVKSGVTTVSARKFSPSSPQVRPQRPFVWLTTITGSQIREQSNSQRPSTPGRDIYDAPGGQNACICNHSCPVIPDVPTENGGVYHVVGLEAQK